MLKGYLSLRGREFVEKNVSKDLCARAELIDLGYEVTPVAIIGDKVLEGFNSALIDEAMESLD